jgi:hypothetical protein
MKTKMRPKRLIYVLKEREANEHVSVQTLLTIRPFIETSTSVICQGSPLFKSGVIHQQGPHKRIGPINTALASARLGLIVARLSSSEALGGRVTRRHEERKRGVPFPALMASNEIIKTEAGNRHGQS